MSKKKNKSGTLTIATDGSYLPSESRGASAWVTSNGTWRVYGYLATDSHRPEISAVYQAIMDHPNQKINVLCDSKSVVSQINQKTRSLDTKNSSNLTVPHGRSRGFLGRSSMNELMMDLVAEIMAKRKGTNSEVQLNWVPGHNKNKLNNYADKLCTHMHSLHIDEIRKGDDVAKYIAKNPKKKYNR